MDKILDLQSEIYIKINSINESYRFIYYICFYISKHQIKKKFKKMEKIIQQYNENTIMRAEYVKMMSHYYADNL
jgi:hypothetical protein